MAEDVFEDAEFWMRTNTLRPDPEGDGVKTEPLLAP
jgi:hypothetical protein